MFCAASTEAILIANDNDSNIIYFIFRDQTAGTVDTGVTVTNIDCYYIEDGALISAKFDVVAHTNGDDAFDDEEGFHMGYGVYRIDFPDAAFDGGVGKRVQLIAIDGDGGAFTEIMEVELSAPVNTVAVGGTTQTANDMSGDVDNVLIAVEKIDTNTELRTLLTGADTPVCKDSTPLTAAEAEAEAVDALESFDLDHLITLACDTGPAIVDHVADNSILAFMLDDAGDISEYDDAKHSQVAIGDDADSILTDTGTTLDDLIDTEIATIVTAVGNIETDTAAMDTAGEWDTLNATLDGKLDTIVTAVGNIETDTAAQDTAGEWDTLMATVDGKLDTAQADLDTITGASGVLIDTDAVDADALKTDAVTEWWSIAMTDMAAAAPSATATANVALNWLYTAWRNGYKTDGTNSEIVLYKDDGTTPLVEADISDDGTDFLRQEYGAPD